MAVKIRMRQMGRSHQPFYRICAVDSRVPRGGKVLEELGTYDPLVKETDARALLNRERIAYWIGVGAQPSPKVGVLIKKYGLNGTHLSAQESACGRLAQPKVIPDPGKPASLPKGPEPETPAEAPAAEAPVAETAVEEATEAAAEGDAAETQES